MGGRYEDKTVSFGFGCCAYMQLYMQLKKVHTPVKSHLLVVLRQTFLNKVMIILALLRGTTQGKNMWQLYRCKKNGTNAFEFVSLKNVQHSRMTLHSLTLIFFNLNPLIIHMFKIFYCNLASSIFSHDWVSFVLSTRDSKGLPSVLFFFLS